MSDRKTGRPGPMEGGPDPGEDSSSLYRILAEKLDGRPGIDWELDAAIRVGNRWMVKIGIYPWGKTVLEGSVRDLLHDIQGILNEIARAADFPLPCPGCGKPQAIGAVRAWRCDCGTEFLISQCPFLDSSPAHDDAWSEVKKLLAGRMNGVKPAHVFAALETGSDFQEMLQGVERLPFQDRAVVYTLKLFSQLRPLKELEPTTL